jgi:hypothetical protein
MNNHRPSFLLDSPPVVDATHDRLVPASCLRSGAGIAGGSWLSSASTRAASTFPGVGLGGATDPVRRVTR